MQEVDCAKVRSWVNSYDIEVLVQKDELKVRSHDQIESISVRKRNCSDGAMRLCNV